MIELSTLIAVGVAATTADAFLPHLRKAFERFSIQSSRQIAAFIAQAAHESASFTRLTENLFYTTPDRIKAVWPNRFASLADAAQFTRNPGKLANRVYANRLGNGDESTGDGARFIGRGLFQLTGRANYMAAGDAIRYDYKARPEVVALPEHAALTAAWFWSANGCNAPADKGDIDRTTRLINGSAMLGAKERREMYEAALSVLS